MSRSCFQFLSLIAAVLLTRGTLAKPSLFVPSNDGYMEAAPDALKDIGVTEKLNVTLPLDAKFVDERGQEVTLGQFFDNSKKPVVLQLGYYGCPMLCDLISQGLVQSLKELKLDPAKDYKVVFISFDPNESWQLAAKKKHSFVRAAGRDGGVEGWHFLTGRQDQIDRVTQAVGYRYKWIESAHQFSHPSVVTICTPVGKVSRYLYPYGMKFDEPTLRLSLVEASDSKIGSTVDHFVLTCFHYDGKQGKYAFAAMSLMRVGGVVTVVVLGTVLWRLFRKEKARRLAMAQGLQSPDALKN